MFLKQLNKSLQNYNKLNMHYFIRKLSQQNRNARERLKDERSVEIRLEKEEKDYN